MAPSLEELSDKLNELTAFVEKQSKIVGKTGEQLIQMQVKDVKHRMANLDNSSKVDMDEYATNDDIVQLVGELQTQLDNLEDRTIKRMINSRLTKSDTAKQIAPLTNKDGDYAPDDLYPKTVKELLGLDKYSVVKLCDFFELLVPLEQQENLNEVLEEQFENVEQMEQELKKRNDQTFDTRLAEYNDEEVDEMFDELARYIGVNIRRNAEAW